MIIRDITSSEMTLFASIVGRLQISNSVESVRSAILPDVVKLLRADGGSSFIWRDAERKFCNGLNFGIAPEIHSLYVDWFQTRDPMTFKMRANGRATIVDQVLARSDLLKSEFYNDMLKIDGLEWGINLYSFDDQNRDLGDLRVWRRKDKENFEDREKMLLDIIEPLFRTSLLRENAQRVSLTPREREVVELMSRGCTDRDIARILGMSFSTVRTHLNKTMDKFGCANRAELAATFVKQHGMVS
ncbi:LuxR C-terminal-related transcriptional regulator [Rhizobium sp. Root1204]|uniref:response regulator transcription factor n=1 Tax=Rhizobium sp. Root1204 TaxID=1736428 RepID=UPI000715CFB1|nr:LuxR C-terminal-related transcriptional regulator [Rhizobium sp. Root1204]KQV41342.1 hypothetical protein ASC96_18805 [Rhizobium sp. Root1204]